MGVDGAQSRPYWSARNPSHCSRALYASMSSASRGVQCTATSNGIEFRFTCNKKTYLSLHYHRGAPTAHKSTWDTSFSRWDEFNLFDASDGQNWRHSGDYYGIVRDAARVVGSRGERAAVFPATQNRSDPWHGYPLLVRPSRDDVIPDTLIDRWVEEGHLTFAHGERLSEGSYERARPYASGQVC